MAKGNGNETATRREWEVDFVSVDLKASDKAALGKWDPKGTETTDFLDQLSFAGWKLSFVRDSRNDCIIASATEPKADDGSRQICLSARGPNFPQAMRVLAYKMVVILEGDLTKLKSQVGLRDQWG